MLIIAPGQEENNDTFSIFLNMKVYCVFSLESGMVGWCEGTGKTFSAWASY